MPKFAVILPAAGKSSRFSKQRKKVFVELKGRPVWVRTAEQFVNRSDVAQTILVVSPEDLDWFKEKFRPNLAFMDIDVVTGGAERADSVQNALA
ncbi:MAG: 2-C-methyl-D-erythritol 4-phosphate cytidylyltransferase, partial [Schlesneria sp.]